MPGWPRGLDALLSRADAASLLQAAERKRNYEACLSRHGYCDRSRLTPYEAAAIPLAADGGDR